MKNKEESSANSQRGNLSAQVDLYRSGDVGPETTGSLSRPGRTVAARAEQPALGLFPMSLMEAVVDQANLETAWKNVKANRGTAQCGPARCGGVGRVIGDGGPYPIR